ncbi:MAG: hypothetical protein JNJ56_03420 [Ignavibacteria bacterium]|nr:hypothetical protein [Ignavibacteria bacterium]
MYSFFRIKSVYIKYSLILLLISFSFLGGNCDKILENQNDIPGEMIGDWILSAQTGALQDICDGEVVNFQSTGIAKLTCPQSETITRNFKVESGELTYTETSVTYSIETLNNDTLYLLGENVSRNLLYLKIPAADFNPDILNITELPDKSKNENSSESGE